MHPSGRPLEGHMWDGALPPQTPTSNGEFSAEWLSRRNFPSFDQQHDMGAPQMNYSFTTRSNLPPNVSGLQGSNLETSAPATYAGGFPNYGHPSERSGFQEETAYAASWQPKRRILDGARAESDHSSAFCGQSHHSKEHVTSYNMSSEWTLAAEKLRPSGPQTVGTNEAYVSSSLGRQQLPSVLQCFRQTTPVQPTCTVQDVSLPSNNLLPQEQHLHQIFSESQMFAAVGLNVKVHSNEINRTESSCADQSDNAGSQSKNDILLQNELQLGSSSSSTCLADRDSRIDQGPVISNVDTMNSGPQSENLDLTHSLMEKASSKNGEDDRNLDGLGANDELSRGSIELNEGSKSAIVASTLGDKLWDGNLQLSSTITVSAVAFFKSGEKMPEVSWTESVEVKGKVRLDAFEKYIQELPRSRNRGLMVISLYWKEGSSKDGLEGMKEVGKKYKQWKRVGYAQPLPGIDLYICPRSDAIITILAKYGFLKGKVAIEDKQDSLIGCAVWRKSGSSSNSASKRVEERKESETGGQPPSSPANSTTQHVAAPSSAVLLGVTEAVGENSGESKIPTSSVIETELAVSSRGGTAAGVSSSANSSISVGKQTFTHADLASLQKTLMQLSKIDASILQSLGLEELKAKLELLKSMTALPQDTGEKLAPPPTTEDDDLPEYDFGVQSSKHSHSHSQAEPIDERPEAHGFPGTTSETVPREIGSAPQVPPSSAPLGPDGLTFSPPPRKRARELESQTPPPGFPDHQGKPAIKGLFDEDDDDMPEWCPPGFDLPNQPPAQATWPPFDAVPVQVPMPSLADSSSGPNPMPPLPPPPMYFPSGLQPPASHYPIMPFERAASTHFSSESQPSASHHPAMHFERTPPQQTTLPLPLPLPPPPPPPPPPPQPAAPSMHFPTEPQTGASMHFSSKKQPFAASHHPTAPSMHEPLINTPHPPSALFKEAPLQQPASQPPPPPPPRPAAPPKQPAASAMHFATEPQHHTSDYPTMPFGRAPSPARSYTPNPSSRKHDSNHSSRPQHDRHNQRDRHDRHDRRDRHDNHDSVRFPRWRDRRR